MSLSSLSSIIQKVCMGHPLYGRGHKLDVGVDDSVRVHVGLLEGLPDLALQAFGTSPDDGELDGLRIPHVLRVPVGEVGGHAVAVQVSRISLISADPDES